MKEEMKEWTWKQVSNMMTGKTIRKADVDGCHVILTFDDGVVFEYSASDGGYSCWKISNENEKTDD